MPKYVMESLEGLAPDVAKLYTPQDGKFIMTGVEGIAPKSKVDEFRNSNIELSNKLKSFEGIDPAQVQTMSREIQEYKIRLEKGGLDDEAINKLVDVRVTNMRTDFESRNKELSEQNQSYAKQLEVLIVDNSVSQAASEHKVLDTALTDVILRAKTVFKVVDGKPVAHDAKGQKIYGADGVSELSISNWVKGLIKTSPHLFQPSVTAGMRDHRGAPISQDRSKVSPLGKIQAGLS